MTKSATELITLAAKKTAISDYENAIDLLTQAIELQPDDAYAYHARGAAKMAMGLYQGALNDYQKAVYLNPSHPETKYAIAAAKRALQLKHRFL